jgi:hypothetical protein
LNILVAPQKILQMIFLQAVFRPGWSEHSPLFCGSLLAAAILAKI